MSKHTEYRIRMLLNLAFELTFTFAIKMKRNISHIYVDVNSSLG